MLDNALNASTTQPIPLSGTGSAGLVATLGVPSTVTLTYGVGGSIPVTVSGTGAAPSGSLNYTIGSGVLQSVCNFEWKSDHPRSHVTGSRYLPRRNQL